MTDLILTANNSSYSEREQFNMQVSGREHNLSASKAAIFTDEA